MNYQLIAPCLFGLESLVADGLKEMGAEQVTAENGRVLFCGDELMIARANIGCRFAERILLCIGRFRATTFTELFDGVRALPWEQYIEKQDAFPVKGWSLHSALHSVPDCQSIVKKAIVERLAAHYHLHWFEETDVKKQIAFSLMKDEVTLTIETSGAGLHKRGYRRNANEAPIKETLAAAICKLSRIYNDSNLYDPFCGSGTLLIEGVMIAKNMAPGLLRSFVSEQYRFLPEQVWRQERMRAQDLIDRTASARAYASDIDPDCVALTMENAQKAGVRGCFTASTADVSDFTLQTERAVVVANPPYGERMLDQTEASRLYRVMGQVFEKRRGCRYAIISPDEQFEQQFGRPADKRRKVYNGNLKCNIYFYYKV